MAKYIKLYGQQGIPVGFTECTEEVESALGDARVKLYDEQKRLVGFRVSEEVVTPRACYRDTCASFIDDGDGGYSSNLASSFEGYTTGNYELNVYDIVPQRFAETAGASNIVYSNGVISFTIENVETFSSDGAIRFYVGDTLYHIDLV